MASAVQNHLRDRDSKPGEYRFPPGFERNLIWFAWRRFRPANPITLFQHLVDKYGDIAHYKIGWNHIVFLNHPDYIREILVVQNDNFVKERTVRRSKMLLGEGMPGNSPLRSPMVRVCDASFQCRGVVAYAPFS